MLSAKLSFGKLTKNPCYMVTAEVYSHINKKLDQNKNPLKPLAPRGFLD